MKTKTLILSILFLVSLAFVASSCKKRKLNRDTTSEQDDAMARSMFEDMHKTVDDEAGQQSKLKEGRMVEAFKMAGNCATVTLTPFDSITFPKTLTIDFGPTNCKGNDNKERRGKIIVTITGKYRETGTVITIKPDNYYINDNKVEGTKVVTNNGRNNAGNLTYSIEVDGKITTPDNKVIEWKSSRTREWIEGESTTFWTNGISGITDDAYLITGTGNGVNRDGRKFTVTITTPLRVQFCGYKIEITKGVLELQPEDLKKRVVDFGNGDCDNQATATIGKKTYTFNLK
ncbi:MAG: hypothetical protein HUU48_08855 [Flavobacteriales bacterium]|nr:hypothetical protein [Flavobacteriales bacterium]